MKVTLNKTIDASADKVWKILAHDFDDAHVWMASIPNSYGKNLGKKFEGTQSTGRVCELDSKPNGIKAYETIEAYNEEDKTIKIRVNFKNAPLVFPFKFNLATFEVYSLDENRCRVLFKGKMTLTLMGYIMYPLLRLGFPKILKQVLDELKYFAENGKPHPKKSKAKAKLKSAQLTA
jgi:hypothetical protein